MKLFLIFIIISSVSANSSIPWSKCDPGSNNNCLIWNNTTLSCEVINCWKYDDVAGCEKAGKPFLPAIILQSIPFTGVFGSGFGNIGRWDIFTTYMWAFFGPLLLLCCLTCCVTFYSLRDDNEDNNDHENTTVGLKILTTACGCLWGVLVFVLWIWGIITIAGKEVDAPWWSANGTDIMCPMV